MSSPTIDAGTHATFNITSFSSASSFTSTANIFETSGANELAVAVIAYQGMALAGGSVTSFTITAGAVVLTFSLYSKVQGPSGSHYQTIEIWTCQAASQFNSGAATTTTALVLSQAIDDGMVSVFAVEGLYDITTPFDTNVSIPNGSVVNSTPQTLTFSTSNADDLLFFVSAQGDTYGATVTPAGWTSIAGGNNAGGARYQNSNVCTKSVSSTQSSATVKDGSATSLPSWAAIVAAFTADAPNTGETGTVVLAFGPAGFAASGYDEPMGAAHLAFGPLAFAGSSAALVSGAGTLAFGPAHFASGGVIGDTGSGSLAFGPIAIEALGYDLGGAGAGLRQFWTF